MIHCKDCVELLADYLDGSLTADQKDQLETHLSYCAPCVTFVRTYKATTRVAKKSLAESMPEEMGVRLHDFIAARLKPRDG
jgi:anti-sigma factor RsiW